MVKTLIAIYQPNLRKLWFSEAVLQKLKQVSEMDWVEEGMPYTSEKLAQDILHYDAIITSWGSPKLTKRMLEVPHRLKFIGHVGGTLVPYLEPEVFEHEITIVNANEALARSTAELAVALMMVGAWELPRFSADLKAGMWRDQSVTVMGLYKQKVGLIGIGQVAREVIRLLRAFDCDISIYSPYCSEEEARQLGVRKCSLRQVLSENRIVSLHDTLTPKTKGMIGRNELAWMKDGSLLVNTARAEIVQKEPLLDELRSGRIRAALDVHYTEPPPRDDELLNLPNVISVPHIGALSAYWKKSMGELVVEDLCRFARGEPPLRPVTAERFRYMSEM